MQIPIDDMLVMRQAGRLDQRRVVHYKQVRQLGEHHNYLVEISTNPAELFIAAYDQESPDSLLIRLPTKRAFEVL